MRDVKNSRSGSTAQGHTRLLQDGSATARATSAKTTRSHTSMELQLAEPDAAQPDSLSFHYAGVSLVTPHDGHDRHLSGSGPAPSRMLIGPGAGPTGTSRATTELHGAVRSDTAGPCAGCAAVAAVWPQPGPCSGLWPLLLRVDAGPRHHRPASAHAPAARRRESGARPFGPGKFGDHAVTRAASGPCRRGRRLRGAACVSARL